jgi:hypothetical protein
MNTDFQGWGFERERESRKNPEKAEICEKYERARGIFYRRDPERPQRRAGEFFTSETLRHREGWESE